MRFSNLDHCGRSQTYIRLSYRTVKSWWNHRSWKRALFKISRVFNAAKNRTEDRLGYLRFSGFQSNTRILAKYWYDCAHGLRTPNKGINQIYLKNWADVADKICFGRYLKIWEWERIWSCAVKAISLANVMVKAPAGSHNIVNFVSCTLLISLVVYT